MWYPIYVKIYDVNRKEPNQASWRIRMLHLICNLNNLRLFENLLVLSFLILSFLSNTNCDQHGEDTGQLRPRP